MNNDINVIFEMFPLGITKSYDEILEDNDFCHVMRDRLQYLCLEYGYSFQWLEDNFGLAYNMCALLHMPLFWHFLRKDTLTLYKNLEKYCFKKFNPPDDDEIILRSIIFLILTKNSKCLDGAAETLDYLLDCLAKQDRKFAKKLLSFSKEDNQKYKFNLRISPGARASWRDEGGFDCLFRNTLFFDNEEMNRIYKYVVCLWPLDERCKIASYINFYFTFSYLNQYEKCDYANDLKWEIIQGMQYLENLVTADENKGDKRDETTDFLKNGVKEEEKVYENVKNEGLKKNISNESSHSRGRKPEFLFNMDGEKDHILTKEWASKFVDYLKFHKSSSKHIDTSKDNYVNKTFVVFYKRWIEVDIVLSQPNGNACYRFLKEDCKLRMKAEMKTYANYIRNMINGAKDLDLIDIELNVHAFLNKHKK